MPNTNQTIAAIAAETLSALRIVISDSQGLLRYATSGLTDHASRVLGLTTTSVRAGELVQVLTDGIISDLNWNWSLGLPVFLGNNGFMTQTPVLTGFLIQVAVVVDRQTLDFEVQEPILL